MRDVFITGAGAHLPGPPIGAEAMEDFIGRVGGRDSRLGRRALRWNGIETRHYALDPEGAPFTSNAAMCARAVEAAAEAAGAAPQGLDHLAAATTQGDLLAPGHAAQVQAALGVGPLEIASFQSVCASALMAAKSAWLSVASGEAEQAAATAGEFSSRWFRPAFYEGSDLIDAKGRLDMSAEFLRWTLSDGAGAVWMAPQPARRGLSLRVDAIDIVSLAHAYDPCMWGGARAAERHDPTKSWAHMGPQAAIEAGGFALMQDFNQLKIIIRAWIGEYLRLVDKGRIDPDAVDHLLLHYSAKSLREEIIEILHQTGGMIPEEKWFNTLATTGNTGSASIWIMLEALWAKGAIAPGQKLLLIVPESGRAMVGFMQVTAVAPEEGK